MLIRNPKSWQIPEASATPESVFRSRRQLLQGIAAGSLAAGGIAGGLTLGLGAGTARADTPADAFSGDLAADPSYKLYPFKRDPRYTLDRPITAAKYSETYNNFYEYSDSKDLWQAAQRLKIRPWTIKIDGLVAKPFTIGIDDLLAKMPLEERLYRHRCVEAWSMAVPWSGFPMSALVKLAQPLGSAKYVRTETFMDAAMAPGESEFWYPWPYIEGVTMAEATNDLAFIGTGLYGKPMPKQDGSPIRLVLPWKYGFKSAKSIVRFHFTETRPDTFWEHLSPSEYGFWANVNPAVPHPRWSQATERVLGTDNRVSTIIWNGYGEYVAELYTGIKDQQLFR
jgi:sulfoxide reductase catalytic subunit YedY